MGEEEKVYAVKMHERDSKTKREAALVKQAGTERAAKTDREHRIEVEEKKLRADQEEMKRKEAEQKKKEAEAKAERKKRRRTKRRPRKQLRPGSRLAGTTR